MRKNKQTLIQGQILYAALTQDKRRELALFVIAQSLYSHKTFNKNHIEEIAKACQLRKNAIYKLIESCVQWGVMHRLGDKKHTIRLISNKEIQEKFGGKLCASAYVTLEISSKGVKETSMFFSLIPAISCAKAQYKRTKKQQNHTYKSDEGIGKVVNGERILTIKEHQLLLKAKKKGFDTVTSDPTVTISNKKGASLCGKSKPTFIKYKYYFEARNVWGVRRRNMVLQEDVSLEEWLIIKKDLEAYGFPAFSTYNVFERAIKRDLACEFILKKQA